MKNVRTSNQWFQVAALAAALASGCVENEDKKAPPPPAEPAPVVPPEPARATVSIDPATAYTITTMSGKCLQFSSNQDMAQAEVGPCNGSKAQQFTLQTVAGGYYSIINANGKCLDVAAFAMGDNGQVQGYQCNAGQNQNWIVAEGPGGSVRLVARHSGKALSILDGGGDGGVAKVTQLTAGSGVNQQFKIKNPNAPAGGESGAGGHNGKEESGKGKKSKSKAKAASGKSAAAEPAKKP